MTQLMNKLAHLYLAIKRCATNKTLLRLENVKINLFLKNNLIIFQTRNFSCVFGVFMFCNNKKNLTDILRGFPIYTLLYYLYLSLIMIGLFPFPPIIITFALGDVAISF
jgi:hypothetical protein